MSAVATSCLLTSKTRKFNSYVAKKQGLTDPSLCFPIESWAKEDLSCSSTDECLYSGQYGNSEGLSRVWAPDDIFFLTPTIDGGFIDLTSSLNYFYSRSLLSSKGKTGSHFLQNQKRETGRLLYSPSASAMPIPFLPNALDNETSIAEICAPIGLMKM